MLQYGAALAVSMPVVGVLLAACGSDDDDPTATTTGAGEATATGEATMAATGTTAMATEPAETEPAEVEPSPTTGDAGEVNPRWMGKEIEPAQHDGGILVHAVQKAEIMTDEPLTTFSTSPWASFPGIFEALLESHPDTRESLGLLAVSWESSDDSLIWIFDLREGVTFHDGELFDADDVKFTLDLLRSPDNVASGVGDISSSMQRIASVSVIDPYTVEVTATAGFAYFADDVGAAPMLAEHVLNGVAPADLLDHPASTGADPAFVVGTGPFMFQEVTPDQVMITVRYEDYWDGRPHLAEIRHVAVAEEFAGAPIQITTSPDPTVTGFSMNLDAEKSPLLQDKRVRHALLLAVDREAIVESAIFGYGVVAEGIVLPTSWQYDVEGLEETYPYDPDRARSLLEEAGWVDDDGDGIRERDGERLSISMLGESGDQVGNATLTIIQQFWADVGVEMVPEILNGDLVYERYNDQHEFDTVIWGFGGSLDLSFNWACASYEGAGNRYRYCNPEMDALLEEFLLEPDQAEARAIMTRIQNIALDDLPVAPLYFPEVIFATNERLHNFYGNIGISAFNMETWWVDS
jgi:peptide/nickel transport system substrate-binding protein